MLQRFGKAVLMFSYVILPACSHSPSLGEQMISQGDNTKVIGEKWVDGDELVKSGNHHVAKGNVMIKKGKHLISDGKSEVKKGNKLIKKGNKMKLKSEHVFHEKFPEINLEEN